ncbi:DUF881 domain-containing protein [Acetivibrio cellulolyticus]|uniref:DUF881 domain-containing protein n=1 Tax=Acetivibrio cellulolyticus TaxID=35830 RepID=UPI0001E2E2BF|nr:DUF881 domain-containing protein [Acetivibrio cellulolyticus]
MKHTKTISITLICIILGVAIAWQYKSIYNNNKTASVQSVTLEDLKDKLIIEKKNNDDLRGRNEELKKELNAFEAAKGDIDLYEKNLKKEVDKAEIIAGFTDVKGAGIVITVKATDFGMVQSRYILQLVNALKAIDAKVVAVNNERIISMTEISDGENAIVVNGIPMNADKPFEIKAIIETQKQDNAIKMLGNILTNLKEYYYLDLTVEKVDSITIPKIETNRSSLDHDLLTIEK